MRNEDQIKAMAAADGYEYRQGRDWLMNSRWHKNDIEIPDFLLPDYFTDANQIDRMVRKLDEVHLSRYENSLHEILNRDDPNYVRYSFSIWKATTAQKVEAYLRAIGKWED
jgi:hypothetical protein